MIRGRCVRFIASNQARSGKHQIAFFDPSVNFDSVPHSKELLDLGKLLLGGHGLVSGSIDVQALTTALVIAVLPCTRNNVQRSVFRANRSLGAHRNGHNGREQSWQLKNSLPRNAPKDFALGSPTNLQTTFSIRVDTFYPRKFGCFEKNGVFHSHSRLHALTRR